MTGYKQRDQLLVRLRDIESAGNGKSVSQGILFAYIPGTCCMPEVCLGIASIIYTGSTSHTVLILISYCLHTLLILFSYCSHTPVILNWYRIDTVL